MKVIVDFDACESHGLCMDAAPEIFELGEDGSLQVLDQTPPAGLRAKLEKAQRECPSGAIRIEE